MKKDLPHRVISMPQGKTAKGSSTTHKRKSSLYKDTNGSICNNTDNSNAAPGKLYYDTGELKYEGFIKDAIPYVKTWQGCLILWMI